MEENEYKDNETQPAKKSTQTSIRFLSIFYIFPLIFFIAIIPWIIITEILLGVIAEPVNIQYVHVFIFGIPLTTIGALVLFSKKSLALYG